MGKTYSKIKEKFFSVPIETETEIKEEIISEESENEGADLLNERINNDEAIVDSSREEESDLESEHGHEDNTSDTETEHFSDEMEVYSESEETNKESEETDTESEETDTESSDSTEPFEFDSDSEACSLDLPRTREEINPNRLKDVIFNRSYRKFYVPLDESAKLGVVSQKIDIRNPVSNEVFSSDDSNESDTRGEWDDVKKHQNEQTTSDAETEYSSNEMKDISESDESNAESLDSTEPFEHVLNSPFLAEENDENDQNDVISNRSTQEFYVPLDDETAELGMVSQQIDVRSPMSNEVFFGYKSNAENDFYMENDENERNVIEQNAEIPHFQMDVEGNIYFQSDLTQQNDESDELFTENLKFLEETSSGEGQNENENEKEENLIDELTIAAKNSEEEMDFGYHWNEQNAVVQNDELVEVKMNVEEEIEVQDEVQRELNVIDFETESSILLEEKGTSKVQDGQNIVDHSNESNVRKEIHSENGNENSIIAQNNEVIDSEANVKEETPKIIKQIKRVIVVENDELLAKTDAEKQTHTEQNKAIFTGKNEELFDSEILTFLDEIHFQRETEQNIVEKTLCEAEITVKEEDQSENDNNESHVITQNVVLADNETNVEQRISNKTDEIEQNIATQNNEKLKAVMDVIENIETRIEKNEIAKDNELPVSKLDVKEENCFENEKSSQNVIAQNNDEQNNHIEKIEQYVIVTKNHSHKVKKEKNVIEKAPLEKIQSEATKRKLASTTSKPVNKVLSYRPPKEVILANPRNGHKVVIDADLIGPLKKHQIEGIKFMYNCCFRDGSGCILAHCMGLGKTFQTIALLHTAVNMPHLETNQILIICPKSTIMNWIHEFQLWLKPQEGKRRIKQYILPETSTMDRKFSILETWSKVNEKEASCFLISYEAFQRLVDYPSSKACNGYSAIQLERIQDKIRKYLLDPADVVICDEGHKIKNDATAICRAVSQIRTKRRIILTGTPMQNNLIEYFTMVNFIKPKYLSSKAKFEERYAEPIAAGQHSDSTPAEVKEMKKCSYALHEKLKVCVQRKEVSILKDFLPEKFEYVLFVPLTVPQIQLYQHFLNNTVIRDGKNLLTDYHLLRKIWTHPKILGITNDEINSRNTSSKLKQNWWRTILPAKDLEHVLSSNKLMLLFEILKECQRKNDKCLIFSEFTQVLDVVEFFLKQVDQQTQSGKSQPGMENFNGPWKNGLDYFRLDGSIAKNKRQQMIDTFNDPNKQRTRLFLISSKAGGQGINLVGANRIILLDTSWNPANDQQSFFRIFRLGQAKNCYIYRLLAMGTMEEKIYSRSVTKQAMSHRVLDKQQVDRHYSMAELLELYALNIPSMEKRSLPEFPKDDVLAHLLSSFPEMAYKYHIHDSLLENTEETELTEEEKVEAWRKFEGDEKIDRSLNVSSALQLSSLNMSTVAIDSTIHLPSTSSKSSLLTVPETNLKRNLCSPIKLESSSDMDSANNNNPIKIETVQPTSANQSNLESEPDSKRMKFSEVARPLKRKNSEILIQPVLKKFRLDEISLKTEDTNPLKELIPVNSTTSQQHNRLLNRLDECSYFHNYWNHYWTGEADKENRGFSET